MSGAVNGAPLERVGGAHSGPERRWENPPVLAPQMLQQRIQNGPLTRRKEGCKRETTQCMGRKLKQAMVMAHTGKHVE